MMGAALMSGHPPAMKPPLSNVGAPPPIAGHDPTMEGRPEQHTPLWMDVPQQPPQRTGVVRSPYSTLSTIGFFLLITFAVAGAGLIGMALWGPDKTIKNRTALATDPPTPPELPSLPASADAPASPPPVADSASAASSSSTPETSPPKKTKMLPQRHRKSKR